MSLIKCPECGKEISDKANVCIHCGCPLEEQSNKYECERCKCKTYIIREINNTLFAKCNNCGYYNTITDPTILAKYNKTICPYCHSTNTKKIGLGGRMLSVGTLGLAGSKIGKQWHCNKCKSDF